MDPEQSRTSKIFERRYCLHVFHLIGALIPSTCRRGRYHCHS
jgi:hypothetical protein